MSSLSICAQYSTDELDLSSDVSIWFDNQIGIENTQLILGTYQRVQISNQTHPFFLNNIWIEGGIKYRGEVFLGIKMIYNIYEDYLIITHPTNLNIANQPIRLDTNQIDWFDIEGNKFLHYQSIGNKSGLYQELFNSDLMDLVAKRIKKEHIEKATDPLGYKSADTYHLIYKDQLYDIRGKASFTRIFPQLKKEIKDFIKSERLVVNRKNEPAMIELTSFCNSKISTK